MKKKYIKPEITVIHCDLNNCILTASRNMHWNPTTKPDTKLDIWEEKDGDSKKKLPVKPKSAVWY